jgi:hypothetical protein
MKYNLIRDKQLASTLCDGTSKKDYLIGWSYKQLIQAFGEPTFNEPSADGKVQKQWVFKREMDGACFTIYDFKTDKQYRSGDALIVAETFNTKWSVGSKVYAGEFVTDILTQLKKKN